MAQEQGFVGAREVIEKRGFRLPLFGSFQQIRLPQLVSEFWIVAHHLAVEPQKMTHLVERFAESLDGFGLGQGAQRFHQLGIVRRLHGGTVEFPLDDAQIFGNPHHSGVEVIHLCVVPHRVAWRSVSHLNISSAGWGG